MTAADTVAFPGSLPGPSPLPSRPHRPSPRLRPSEVESSPFHVPSRRREPRYHALQDRVWLQWWQKGDLNGLSARLVNVSRHGAMILAGVRFEECQTIRVILEDTPSEVHAMGTVRGVVAGAGGLYKVRLEFESTCPDGFFQAVANGFEAWLCGSRSWV
ncbi:MAG: PilZ domain-containing protein [Isosphaeraceae bacterium]